MPDKTLWELREEIFKRLRELGKLNFPRYQTYQKPDGTWVDREETPEHLEQEELIFRAKEIAELEWYFSKRHNPLMISLSLRLMTQQLSEEAIQLQSRIAHSVYTNSPSIQYQIRRGNEHERI